jgi:nucleoside 2-deoxyribosyltransferase
MTMGKAEFTALEVDVLKLADVLAGDFTRRTVDHALDPTEGSPPPAGSRSARLHQLLGFVKQYLLAECSRPSHGENARTRELLRRVVALDEDIYREASQDPSARELEPRAWALARDARSLARLAHVTIGRPRWPSRHVRQDARSVFVSGALPGELPDGLIRERGIELLVAPRHGEPATERYNQLRSADLAIFRLVDASDAQHPDVGAAQAQLANTCYELGIALTLGLSILIVADEEAQIPFDATVEVVRLRRGVEVEPILVEALEDLAFGIHWGGDAGNARNSLELTVDFARRHLTDKRGSEARVAWAVAAESISRPHEFVDRLQRFLAYCKNGIELFYPAWPATYPKRDERRCFHASASANWAEVAGEVVRDVCRVRGATYSRSTDAEPVVLRGVWGKVSSASHVIADLTNLDANVAIQLGMAHTLGKPCLLVLDSENDADESRVRRAFPAIAGDTIHAYSASDRYMSLERQVAELLSDSST